MQKNQDVFKRRFDADLVIQYDSHASEILKKEYWRVVEPFRFYLSEREWVTVPAGYLTDGASVPRPFWWLLPPWGSYGQCAVMHDIMVERLMTHVEDVPNQIKRSHADWVFREAMEATGVNLLKRTVMYWGVRFFTGLHLRLNRKKHARKLALELQWPQMATKI